MSESLNIPVSEIANPLNTLRTSAQNSSTGVKDLEALGAASPLQLSRLADQPPLEISSPHLSNVPAGYPRLAMLMGLLPETAVFRRFGFLNKLNLLYMQAELKSLEEKLKEIQRRDCQGPGYEQYFTRDFRLLNDSEEYASEQLKLVLVIQAKLEKYNAALIQQSQMLQMTPPIKSDLEYIQHYLASKDMGPFALAGPDCEIWGSVHEPKGHEPDIVTLLPRKATDMFTKLLNNKGTPKLFQYGAGRFLKPSPVHGLVGFEESTLSRVTYLTTTGLASLIPVASIVVLYFISSMKLRLGFIAIFTVLLSMCLAFFTSAKRAEIFALTAAFSAVQVVFVQVGNNQASVLND
ncbi:MAG: hypothetical protein M1821_008769 [Bathelium mastoideum]|nr:MAG: hypothetical protein M1821_008769 [Bathelium mastoideum]